MAEPTFGQRAVRALDRRWAGAAARISRWMGTAPKTVFTARSILVLCDGNMCRSPFAEVLLRERLGAREVVIESAGLHAAHGDPAPPNALAAAQARGLSLAGHRSRPITAAMVAAADLVLVMNLDQRKRLVTAHPDAADKVELLASYDPDRRASPEIRDPMFGDADLFRDVYARIEAAVEGLVATLDRRE